MGFFGDTGLNSRLYFFGLAHFSYPLFSGQLYLSLLRWRALSVSWLVLISRFLRCTYYFVSPPLTLPFSYEETEDSYSNINSISPMKE